MSTTDQIPDGWDPRMSDEEIRITILHYIRTDEHLSFVVRYLQSNGFPGVEMLVDATCNIWEPAQCRVKFLQLIRQIKGSVNKRQMARLDTDIACREPIVREVLNDLLEENNYHRINTFLDDLEMNLYRHLQSKR